MSKNAELKSLYLNLKEQATTEYEKKCLQLIKGLDEERYRLWSENLDLTEKVELMQKRILELTKTEKKCRNPISIMLFL